MDVTGRSNLVDKRYSSLSQRLLLRFARLDFAAGKLPFVRDVFLLAGVVLQAESLFALLDDSGDYFVVFHVSKTAAG